MKLQKETESLDKHGKWYQDACGTAFAMEIVGERWSILIIRELMLGGRRFSDLRASLPGISAKVLTERLGGLEQQGVLIRRKLPPPAATQVYELTSWGYLAEPAIQELGRWAARSPEHNLQLPLSPVSFMLELAHDDRPRGGAAVRRDRRLHRERREFRGGTARRGDACQAGRAGGRRMPGSRPRRRCRCCG